MSVQYRAIWRDDRPDLIDTGKATFQEWVTKKNLDLTVPAEGHEVLDDDRIRVDRVSETNAHALRIRLDEVRSLDEVTSVTQANGKERWTTTALWMINSTGGWTWVDLEWVSDDISARSPDISAPNLVSMLLALKTDENDQAYLGPNPSRVSTEEDLINLVTRLYTKDRSVPVVVYSLDRALQPDDHYRRVSIAARRLAGCADVRVLTEHSQDLFHGIMQPTSMSVFGGAVRIYLPGILRDDPQPWKHRYIQGRYLPDDPFKASRVIVRRILPRMAAQRPPTIYRTIRPWLGHRNRDWEEYAMELDEEISIVKETNRGLQAQIADIRDNRDMAMEEAKDSERSAYRARYRLDLLRNELRIAAKNPDVVEHDAKESLEPHSCSMAIRMAKEFGNIVVHPDAPRNIARMDRQEDSELWGLRIYRHLRALSAYADSKVSDSYDGGFIEWCNHSGHENAISATKFVTMKESQYVRTRTVLMKYRYFPVDQSIDPNGRITMESHLKPVQGGGLQIPRIYFYDDTMGSTGKVHIGFIGPHNLVPNKSTH